MRHIHRKRNTVHDIRAKGLRETCEGVTGRASEENGFWMVVSAARHPQRLKNLLKQKLLVTFSADLLNDVSEEDVAGVGIPHLRSRFKIQRLVFEQLDRSRHCRWQPLKTKIVGQLCVFRNASRMSEQL